MIVYINNDKIQFVKNNPKYLKTKNFLPALEINLKPGSIVNGVIINQDEIVNQLKKCKRQIQSSVTLIVDSSNIQVKLLDMPKLSKSQRVAVMKNEFSIGSENADILYEAVAAGVPGNPGTMLCYALQADFIRSYMEVFALAKISVKKIEIAVQCVVNYVRQLKQLNTKTFIMNIISDQSMLSFLFDKGKYVITSRNRLLNDENSEEYLRDLYAKTLSMIQFHESQKSVNKIEASYYFGLDDVTMSDFSQYSAGRNADLKILPLNFGLCHLKPENRGVFSPQLGLYKNDDIDLLNSLQVYEKQSRNKGKKLGFRTAFAVFLCLLLAGSAAVLYLQNISLVNDLDALNALQEDPERIKSFEAILKMAEENNLITEKIRQIALVKTAVKNGDTMNGSKYMTICVQTPVNVQIEGFDYRLENNTLTITGYALDALSADQYVRDLRKTDLFESIDYSGYSQFIQEEQPRFSFTLVCTLKAGDQK